MTMAGKTVLVTGANRGIGRALVEEAPGRGAARVYAGVRQAFLPLLARSKGAIVEGWRHGVAKALERQNAAFVQPQRAPA